MKLDCKIAVVTGGGGAIGRAIALKLAGEGARTAIVDANQEAADAVAREIAAQGGNARAYAVDISRFDAVRETMDSAASHLFEHVRFSHPRKVIEP